MDNSPNLIIAGVNKAGTTSLFSYLARHPQVGSSSIKETCYFLSIRYGEPLAPIEEYQTLFEHINSSAVIMEATPGYFYGGLPLIERLKCILPEVKIIILLRDPADRLISFFNSMKAVLALDRNMTLGDYISTCHSLSNVDLKQKENNRYFGVEGGYYSSYVNEWLEGFNTRLKILFFDDLQEHPGRVVYELCQWLEIDSGFYRNFDFGIENQTAQYKNRRLHNTAITVNKKFETLLRRHPAIKYWSKQIYAGFNLDKNRRIYPEEKIMAQLLYLESNQELATILKQYGISVLPEWLMRNVDSNIKDHPI